MPYLPARRLVALYAPLVPVLEATLKQPIEIASAPDYPQHLARLRAGEYDIVADSLFLPRIAQRELGHIPIARTRAPLEPILVVSRASPVKSLVDLRGAVIAVTDRLAALSVLGLRHLRDQGLVPERDFRLLVSGSHANSLHRLIAGEATAAIVSRTTLKQVDAALATQVREVAPLPTGLSAVVYHIAPHLAQQAPALSKALLDFVANTPSGTQFIKELGHEGLIAVQEAEMKALDPFVAEYYRLSTRE
ncbi:MAG: phosphate/phosphite/phosphonate ABC transporter substrate-binding protein [Rhodocyclaceae bacterium]|nr:phosphate/phosphite/phosphonate ABC transporter substrate-binding protein [Rhodocyclaceae bacterium]